MNSFVLCILILLEMFSKGGKTEHENSLSVIHKKTVFQIRKKIDGIEGRSKRIEFLKWCLEENLMPKSRIIKLKLSFTDRKVEAARKKLEKSILRADIGKKKGEIVKLKSEIGKLVTNVKMVLTQEDSELVIQKLCKYKDEKKRIESRDCEKLKDKLRQNVGTRNIEKREEKCKIFKIGQVELNKEEEDFLELGKGFSVMKPRGRAEIVCDVEEIIRKDKSLKEGEKDVFRKQICDVVQKDIFQKSNLMDNERKGFQSIKERDDIVIMRADKGGGIVAMEKNWYEEQVLKLADTNFVKLEEKKEEEFVKQKKKWFSFLQNKGIWSKKDREKFRDREGQIPVMMGFPKIHKEVIGLRPVISGREDFKKEIGEVLKKFIDEMLEVNNDNAGVKNTFEAITKFEEECTNDGLLFSFDVKSMYPSLKQSYILERVRVGLETLGNGNLWVVELLKWYLENCFCQIGKEKFCMIEGLPIGDILSPGLAELGMRKWVEKVKEKGGSNLNFFIHYVDDCCGQWKSDKRSLEIFKKEVECPEWGIQLDLEVEEDGKLQFLDIEFIRENDGKWERKWFQKDCQAGVYCHERSAVGGNVKRNMILNLFDRIKRICTKNWLKEGVNRAINQLVKCDYNKGYLTRLSKDVLKGKKYVKSTGKKTYIKQDVGYVGLNYNGKVSERVKRICEKRGYKVYFKNGGKLEHRVRRQNLDIKGKEFSKGVVYQINCKDCNGCYIGETGREVKKRVKEHIRSLKYGDERNAIFQHWKETAHDISLDKVEILCKEEREICRRWFEHLEINKNSNTFNIINGLDINAMWDGKCRESLIEYWENKTKRSKF